MCVYGYLVFLLPAVLGLSCSERHRLNGYLAQWVPSLFKQERDNITFLRVYEAL